MLLQFKAMIPSLNQFRMKTQGLNVEVDERSSLAATKDGENRAFYFDHHSFVSWVGMCWECGRNSTQLIKEHPLNTGSYNCLLYFDMALIAVACHVRMSSCFVVDEPVMMESFAKCSSISATC